MAKNYPDAGLAALRGAAMSASGLMPDLFDG